MNEQDVVSEGRAALARIKEHSRRLFEDYLAVGDALNIGRAECLKLAGSNSIQSPIYRTHWRRWLDLNGFGAMDGRERLDTMDIAERKVEVIRWRDGLDEVGRRNANHPHVIITHMRAGTQPAARGPKPGKKPNHVVQPDLRREGQRLDCYGPRPQRPCGDLIRRVGSALGQSRFAAPGSDLYGLASVAIEALTVEDLRALMPVKLKMSTARPAQLAMELSA
jgi:hypothetical protein